MPSGSDEGPSAVGTLGRNWRSALVVNGLFDALEETERQRDELAQNLSKQHGGGTPLFDALEEEEDDEDDNNRSWPMPIRDRGGTCRNRQFGSNGSLSAYESNSSSGATRKQRQRSSPPLLRHSLLKSSATPSGASLTATTAAATRSSSRNTRNHTNDNSYRHADPEGGREKHQRPARKGARARKGGGIVRDATPEERMPPPPPRTGTSAVGFRGNGRDGSGGTGSGSEGANASHERGARPGRRGRDEDKEGGDRGLSAASVGSIAGELRGGELERVRGRVADLGAAIETSQSKLLRELSQVQEDFFSSFGYTPPLEASAATSAATSGGVGGVGFPSDISPIPSLARGGAGRSDRTGAGVHGSSLKDPSRSPRWGGGGNRNGGRVIAFDSTSTSPRARKPPLRRRDLDETEEEEEEEEEDDEVEDDEVARDSSYHRVGTKVSRGRSGRWGRSGGGGGVRLGGEEPRSRATVDGAPYAFPVATASSRRSGEERAGGRRFDANSIASSPRVVRKAWKSLSPSPRAAAAAAGTAPSGWPMEDLGSARRYHGIHSASINDRERLMAELVEKEELARELEACRREVEEFREREERREREVEELVEREACERNARREVEEEYERIRASNRTLEESSSELREKAEGLERKCSELERASSELEQRSAKLEEKAATQEREILLRGAELERVSMELRQTSTELENTRGELGETKELLLETKGLLEEKAADLERAMSQIEEREAKLEEADERRRRLETERDRSLQSFRDLQAVHEDFQEASRERIGTLSERAASAISRARSKAVRHSTLWRWRAITLEKELDTAALVADKLRLRLAKRKAFGKWLGLSRRRTLRNSVLSRLLRRRVADDQRGALRRWVRQAAAVAAAAASAELQRIEADRVRQNAAAVLSESLARGRRQSLESGMVKLREGVELSRAKSQALRHLSIRYHRRGLNILSVALSRWRRQVSASDLKVTTIRRLSIMRRRRDLVQAVRGWRGAVATQRAIERLAGRVDGAVRRARVARAVRAWREECVRHRNMETLRAGQRCRRVLSERLASAARRNLLMRCLLGWKAYAVTRRLQLRSARSFVVARDRRVLRGALVAWRDGHRRRDDAARKLWDLGRACRTAALREGMRRLRVSARDKGRLEAEMVVSSARLETEELRRERDGVSQRLVEAIEENHRAGRQRVKVEKELARRQRLAFGRECFAAWKREVQIQLRKRACMLKMLRRNRHGFLHEAFFCWRGQTRAAAAMGAIERVVVSNARQKLLQKTLRTWSEGARRRRVFAAVFRRAKRAVRAVEQRQQREAFRVWKAAAENERRRAVRISSACARLRAVQKRTGRLQVTSAFSVWARLSSASSFMDRRAEIAFSAKRQKTLRAYLSALRANASLRRRARLVLSSLDRRCCLRRLARGWGALLRAAATGSAEERAVLRLGKAEAAVAAGRLAARARAHRTARRLLGVARGRVALEAFVAWRGLVREGRGARLGAAALARRSRRRRVRALLVCWRQNALASSRLRSRTLVRIAKAAESLVSEALSLWRDRNRGARERAKVLKALVRVRDRTRFERAEMSLALKTWRRNAGVGHGGDEGEDWERLGGAEPGDVLEAVAGVFIEAAAAFSTAASVPQVFGLVQEFVAEVAFSSSGRLLLLNGEPGGGMFCLELDRTAPHEQEPLETAFPIGSGLVSRCVATGLALQTTHPGDVDCDTGGVSSACSGRRLLFRNGNAESSGSGIDIALTGPADLYALPLPEAYDLGSPCFHAATHGAQGLPQPQPQPLSVSFQGWKKRPAVAAPAPAPESASTVLPPPVSWDDRRDGQVGGSPVPGSAGGSRGRGRSRLAFFPATDDCGSSRSPSPAGPAGFGIRSRGYGFLSNSPPRGHGSRRSWSESESPSPRRRQQQQQQQQLRMRSPSPLRNLGVGARVEDEREDESVVLQVACLPVTGGDGGQAMIGVLKAWRQQRRHRQRGGERNRASRHDFSGGEMAALGVLAGQAAAALRRLGAEAADREGELQQLDAAAAHRVDEAQKREEALKDEIKNLREAMEHVSDSAKGLVRQRDDARVALTRAKGTLRRIAPALRDARDRQLGFRHYHDLIVNMSRAVLENDGGYGVSGAGPTEEEEEDTNDIAASVSRCCGRGGGGCCREAARGGSGERESHAWRRSASAESRSPCSVNDRGGRNSGRRMCSPDAACTRGVRVVGSDSRRQGGATCSSRSGARHLGRASSASRNGCGFEACCSSPKDRAAAAVSLARSAGCLSRNGDGIGHETPPEILTVLRETAAAGDKG